MVKLTTEQLIYLLYARAYTETETVTKSAVKSCLPSEWKGKADESYKVLHTEDLIRQTSKGRFTITKRGLETLINNLASTSYKFSTAKGARVLNTLLTCIKEASETHSSVVDFEGMTFDEFQEKFKVLYLKERKQQEIRGVVAIYSDELRRKFIEENSISREKLSQYFELLKSTGKVFAVDEKDNELIQWVE